MPRHVLRTHRLGPVRTRLTMSVLAEIQDTFKNRSLGPLCMQASVECRVGNVYASDSVLSRVNVPPEPLDTAC